MAARKKLIAAGKRARVSVNWRLKREETGATSRARDNWNELNNLLRDEREKQWERRLVHRERGVPWCTIMSGQAYIIQREVGAIVETHLTQRSLPAGPWKRGYGRAR